MLTTSEIRTIYEKIQKQLFYMIPEKWDRVYLYASVLDHHNNMQTGEMFFYYYPKSILRKNPVNVYEVPNKFNIDEQAYLRLAEKLYKEIKRLRTYLIKMGEEPWSNLTIRIQDFKFNIDYSYEDLVDSSYTSYDRHLIWRYKYLNVPISSYSKKDRRMLERYLEKEGYYNQNITTYSEGLYRVPVSNIIDYNHVSADYQYNEEQQYIKRKRINIDDEVVPNQKDTKKPKEYLVADSIKMPEQNDVYAIKNSIVNKENIYERINNISKEVYNAPVKQKAYKVSDVVLEHNSNYNNNHNIENTINQNRQYANRVTLQENIEEKRQVKQYANRVTVQEDIEEKRPVKQYANKVTVQEDIEEKRPVKQYANKVTVQEDIEEIKLTKEDGVILQQSRVKEPVNKNQYINKVTWYEPEEEQPKQYINKVTWYEPPENIIEDKQYVNTVTMSDDEDITEYNDIEIEEPMGAKAVNQILGFM